MKGCFECLAVTILVPVIWGFNQQISSPINREIGFLFESFKGHILSLKTDAENVRKKTVPAPDKMQCAFACVGANWCRSINFNITKENGLHKCEMVSTHKYHYPNNFTEDKTIIHLSIKNPCEERPCHNDGSCIFLGNRQDYRCNCKKGFTGENCEQAIVNIFVQSEGCSDVPNRLNCTLSKCSITVNNVEHCPNTIGHNVVVLDKFGVYQKNGAFNTHNDATSGQNMKTFLDGLQNETIVLIAVQDSGEGYAGDAETALRSVGAVNPLAVYFQSSWLLVGYKGGLPSWITERRADRYKGPSRANVSITVPVI